MEINKIYNNDCLDIMSKIPDKFVDLVITDPPYIQDSHGGGGAFGTRMREYHKGVDSLGYGFENNVLSEILRIQKNLMLIFFVVKIK